jgi:RNA polymerase sigma factor (sigma-70 family)
MSWLFEDGTSAGLPEWHLLQRFVSRRDESAFEALVARHGPMVLGVCRRVLDDPHAADDAFQATFLVLVRKARSLGERDAIGHWLYGVAHRVALRARADALRRRRREQPGETDLAPSPGTEPERSELASVIDAEVHALPAKYRAPVVLCYFEGLTHEEAAAELGWPVGTVKGRLARARDRLRSRLARRGLAPGSLAVAAALSRDASAAVPERLAAGTVRAASHYVTGRLTGGLVSATAAQWTEGMLSTMFATKIKLAAAVGVSVGGLLLGAWALAQPGPNRGEGRTHGPTGAAAFGSEDQAPGMVSEDQVVAALGARVPLNLKGATLQAALKQVKAATAERSLPTAAGLPIYVDPEGLKESGATMQSPASITADNAPLRDSLDQMLRPLKLAATVRDGVLVISSRQEVALIEVRKLADRGRPPRGASGGPTGLDLNSVSPAGLLKRVQGVRTVYHSSAPSAEATPEEEAQTKAILEALKKPVAMQFPNETPLEDVLRYVKATTKGKDLPDGLPIYVDPVALQEAEKTLASPVLLDLSGVALRDTLRLALKQLGLVYSVGGGLLTITSQSSEDTSTPILTLAEKAEHGDLSLDEMKQLIEVFRMRAEIQRYASGLNSGGGAQPGAAATPAPSDNAPPQAGPADDEATNAAILNALERTVDLSFSGKPLAEVIKDVQKLTAGPGLPDGIPVFVGSSPQTQGVFEIDLKRVKLKTALRLLLSQVGATFVVRDGIVIIATVGSPLLEDWGPGQAGARAGTTHAGRRPSTQ